MNIGVLGGIARPGIRGFKMGYGWEYEANRAGRFLWYVFRKIKTQIPGNVDPEEYYTVKVLGADLMKIHQKAKFLMNKAKRAP